MKRTCYVTEYEKLYDLLMDRTKTIKDFHILDEGMVAIEYVKSKEFLEINTNTNVIIASFCTTYAQLKLWNVMLRLGDHVIYHDTDSVIYSYYPGQWRPPTGCYLGDLTDELTCKAIGCSCLGLTFGHWIVEFISSRAKNYAYHLNTGQVMWKVRGFSLNFSASQIVNLKNMEKALYAWKNKEKILEMVTVKTMIMHNKLSATVYTAKNAKTIWGCV